MAGARNRETTDDGQVLISKDELREYEELKAKRDRSLGSMRAQMQAQDYAHTKEKVAFARDVKKLIDTAGIKNLTALADKLAVEVLDRANEILAQE